MKKLIIASFALITSLTALGVPYEGQKMMVVGPSPYAVESAKKIMKDGGNAVDVAVAMGLTLTVTHQYFGSLGGGGFALIKMGSNPVVAIDFREIAPLKTHPEFYEKLKDDASENGGTAVGVPGFPAGLWEMHSKYGKLPWKRLFDDVIRLADQGFEVSGDWARITEENVERFNQAGLKYFLKAGKKTLGPGEKLSQQALKKALILFRDLGPDGFYKGEVAEDLVNSVKSTGGVLVLKDLANYKTRTLEPLKTDYKGHQIYLMPPPSSGGIVLKTALYLFDKLGIDKLAPFSVDEFHMLAEVQSRSFRARALLGDPDFNKIPYDKLFSPAYLDELENAFDPKKKVDLKPLEESEQTTHYSVLDSMGNAVALTVTLNGEYGSGIVSDKFGIALNNEMDDFTTHPGKPNQFGLIQGKANSVEPGKRPLSSMSPTLVEKDGKIVMSLGAPGGPKIITGVLQTLYRILSRKMDIDEAIQSPRIHHQFLPRTSFTEANKFTPETLAGLHQKGHETKNAEQSRVCGVRVNDRGWLEAAFDHRAEGAAGGY